MTPIKNIHRYIRASWYILVISILAMTACGQHAVEYHVVPSGSDANKGTLKKPLKTITRAAEMAMPGDTITVHEGVYREQINPPRSGSSNEQRITYRAAEGEKVVIKGSEPVTGWEYIDHNTWKVHIPNHFFGDFNPYQDTIYGDWFNGLGRTHHTGAVYFNGHWLIEAESRETVLAPVEGTALWYAESDGSRDGKTIIWAQFYGADPNESLVEINVRQSVFYPDIPGINYLTIKGFVMEHAATPWSPPTAEQIGLMGTHWSKGWIIEDNIIRYSRCVGITLGKQGDAYDNTSQNSAEGYVETINRALDQGWSKENIGHHVVRNNEISHCEQAGIVGSMGAVFSIIAGNVIHDIHIRQLFTGAEMAGIKIHAPIDAEIRNNHIFRCNRGIWLDWMTQGTRISRNFLHDNGPSEDFFLEVNHGPFLLDHNISLSDKSLMVNSQGGAYVHNLFAGSLYVILGETRQTPHHRAHSTEVVDLADNPGGDERYYNNLVAGRADFGMYDQAVLPMYMDGNVYINGSLSCRYDINSWVNEDFDPSIRLIRENGTYVLEMNIDRSWIIQSPRKLVTSVLLGKAHTPGLPYEDADGRPYRLDRDYFGHMYDPDAVSPGPFAMPEGDFIRLKVWPVNFNPDIPEGN